MAKGTKYEIDFLLGGDWKFLVCVCGIDSATATYSCIWCTCSKSERHLDKQWSIVDEEYGAQSKVSKKLLLFQRDLRKIQLFKPSIV